MEGESVNNDINFDELPDNMRSNQLQADGSYKLPPRADSTSMAVPPQRGVLVHETREMLANHIAKYNDPHNLEWDWEDVHDKWKRHAYNAFTDLQAAEAEIERLSKERDELKLDKHRDAIFIADLESKLSQLQLSVREYLAHDGRLGSQDYDAPKLYDARKQILAILNGGQQ